MALEMQERNEYVCPILRELMEDPVMAADGYFYERRAIEEWFQRGHRTSPMTGLLLPYTMLVPTHQLRSAIRTYQEQIPLAIREQQIRQDLQLAINLREQGVEEVQRKFANLLSEVEAEAARPIQPIRKLPETAFEYTGEQPEEGSAISRGFYTEVRTRARWLGKSNSLETEAHSEVEALQEKISSDVYALFGVPVPPTCVAHLPLQFRPGYDRALLNLPDERTHAVHLMSRWVEGFHAYGAVNRENILALRGHERFLTLQTPEGLLPEVGLGRVLAVALLLNDQDVFGGEGGNIGYVIETLADQRIAKTIKIDPGYGFTEGVLRHDIPIDTNGGQLRINVLPEETRREFWETLDRIVNTPNEILAGCFLRNGLEIFLFPDTPADLRAVPAMLAERLIDRRNALAEMYVRELNIFREIMHATDDVIRHMPMVIEVPEPVVLPLPDHVQLMRNMADALNIPFREVNEGIVIEQTLVRMAGVECEQRGAQFRRTADDKTYFQLKLNDVALVQFRQYYHQNFPGLIVEEHPRRGEWVRMDMDTRCLAERAVPALGAFYQHPVLPAAAPAVVAVIADALPVQPLVQIPAVQPNVAAPLNAPLPAAAVPPIAAAIQHGVFAAPVAQPAPLIVLTHEQLMERFEETLQVDHEEVFDGTVVEQTLINMAGIDRDQTGAMFRRHDEQVTYFNLRLTDEEQQNFAAHYQREFPELIQQIHPRVGDWVRVDLNTMILAQQVTPAMGGFYRARVEMRRD